MQGVEILHTTAKASDAGRAVMKVRKGFSRDEVQGFLEDVFEGDVHAKRVRSLANATTRVLTSASLAVSAIGQGMAHACGVETRYAVKQVDRLVGNAKVEVWSYFAYWVPYVVAERKAIVVALDWTDFDRDGQATLALNLLTGHGRAIPLIWRTVDKAQLKGQRSRVEDSVLHRLKQTLPAGVAVTVVMDRGFVDTALLEQMSQSWQFGYLLRLRGNLTVEAANGEVRPASAWVGAGGRSRTLRGARLTEKRLAVPTVVCTRAKGMKDTWCLASSDPHARPATLLRYYAKRWGIESYFRDTKDLRFGLGLDAIHTRSPERRDRLFLLSAFAIVLLTLLGAACEAVGYDRYLKANTVKRRTHSLFRQGLMIYELIPTLDVAWLRRIMQAFGEAIQTHRALSQVFSAV